MSGNGDGDDPKYDESCETKRIGQNNKEEAELAIPYLPNQDFVVTTSGYRVLNQVDVDRR